MPKDTGERVGRVGPYYLARLDQSGWFTVCLSCELSIVSDDTPGSRRAAEGL